MENITKEALSAEIESFLVERKKTDGPGWPEVTSNEVHALGNIVEGLISLKYEEDVDGDLPINYTLVDRTKYYHPFLHYCKVEYPSRLRTLGEYVNQLRDAENNLAIAQSELTKITRYIFSLISQDDKLKDLVINERE